MTRFLCFLLLSSSLLFWFTSTQPLFPLFIDHTNNFSIIKCQRMMMKWDIFRCFLLLLLFIFVLNPEITIEMIIDLILFFFFQSHTTISTVTFAVHFYDFTIMINCLFCVVYCFSLAMERGWRELEKKKRERLTLTFQEWQLITNKRTNDFFESFDYFQVIWAHLLVLLNLSCKCVFCNGLFQFNFKMKSSMNNEKFIKTFSNEWKMMVMKNANQTVTRCSFILP